MKARFEKMLDQATARLETLQAIQTREVDSLAQAQKEFNKYRLAHVRESEEYYVPYQEGIKYAAEAITRATEDIKNQQAYIADLMINYNVFLKCEPLRKRSAGSLQVGGLFDGKQADQNLIQPPKQGA
jgi:hypothetical protein